MSDTVEVPFGDKPGDTATLLLAAAEELDLGQEVVVVSGSNFVVPTEVNDKAFGGDKSDDKSDDDESDESKAEKKTAKKASAKKSQE